MKKALLLAATITLVAPTAASGKEVRQLDVCGASGCKSITDRAVLDRIGDGSNGGTYAATPRLQPFYRLVYTVDAETGNSFTFTNYYIPAAKLIRSVSQTGYTTWDPASSEFAGTIAELGGEPLATPTVDG